MKLLGMNSENQASALLTSILELMSKSYIYLFIHLLIRFPIPLVTLDKFYTLLTSVGCGSSFQRRDPFSTFLIRGVSLASCGGVESCSLYQVSGLGGYWGCSFFWYLFSEVSRILSESCIWISCAPV